MTMSMLIERRQRQRGEDTQRQLERQKGGCQRERRETDVAIRVSPTEVLQQGLLHASIFSTNSNRQSEPLGRQRGGMQQGEAKRISDSEREVETICICKSSRKYVYSITIIPVDRGWLCHTPTLSLSIFQILTNPWPDSNGNQPILVVYNWGGLHAPFLPLRLTQGHVPSNHSFVQSIYRPSLHILKPCACVCRQY